MDKIRVTFAVMIGRRVMSDLGYKTVEDLEIAKDECEQMIKHQRAKVSKANNIIGGQEVRLQWINTYIYEKTPQEMTMQEIEEKLGHKVMLK